MTKLVIFISLLCLSLGACAVDQKENEERVGTVVRHEIQCGQAEIRELAETIFRQEGVKLAFVMTEFSGIEAPISEEASQLLESDSPFFPQALEYPSIGNSADYNKCVENWEENDFEFSVIFNSRMTELMSSGE